MEATGVGRLPSQETKNERYLWRGDEEICIIHGDTRDEGFLMIFRCMSRCFHRVIKSERPFQAAHPWFITLNFMGIEDGMPHKIWTWNTGTARRLFFELTRLDPTSERIQGMYLLSNVHICRSYRGHCREIRFNVSYWWACDCCCFDVSLFLCHPYCNVIKSLAITKLMFWELEIPFLFSWA